GVEAGPVVVGHHRMGRALIVRRLDRHVGRLRREWNGKQRKCRDARLDQLESHVALSPGGWIQVASSSSESRTLRILARLPRSRRTLLRNRSRLALAAGHPTPPERGRGALVNEINRNMINGP